MSNKEAYYFSHDSNARLDEKILALRMKHSWEGYGLYWALIEKLRESSKYMSVCDYNVIAYDLRTDAAKIKSIIEDFRLFAFTEDEKLGKCFYSESLKSRMEVKDSKSEKARMSALQRWNKVETDANGMRTHSDGNANKVKESKVNNITTNKILFVSIKNLNEYIRTFEGNKTYLLLAYRFWELWRQKYPNHSHLKKADVYDWVDTIRKIVELDKQTTTRLAGIMVYFRLCLDGDKRINNFWFNTIKSIHAFREADKNGVKYLDSMSDEINPAIKNHEDIRDLIVDVIEKLKKYESNQSPKKQV